MTQYKVLVTESVTSRAIVDLDDTLTDEEQAWAIQELVGSGLFEHCEDWTILDLTPEGEEQIEAIVPMTANVWWFPTA